MHALRKGIAALVAPRGRGLNGRFTHGRAPTTGVTVSCNGRRARFATILLMPVLSLVLPACTGTLGDGRQSAGPAVLDTARFAAIGVQPTGRCEDVSGRYADTGSVLQEAGERRASGFAAGVFRWVLPADQGRPRANEAVGLRLSPASSALAVELWGAGVGRSETLAYACEDGWVRVVTTEGHQALADGVEQRALRSDVWLARARTGEILVQVSARGRDSHYLRRNLPWSKDAWYRFPPLPEDATR